ncbi:hypothetical protein FACS189472_13930 [Alphaproteobacteria bacterium]|nr:hypothetical protein FACS189472_13930 [Alphaproteobacteria bacterium]
MFHEVKSTQCACPCPLDPCAPRLSEIDEVINYEMGDIDEVDKNADELHTVIHPSIKFTLNSLNVLVGQTGSGKSRAVFREISKLKYIENNPYHEFIYICDEDNDKTYVKYKAMIPVPITKIPYKDAFQKLCEIVRVKNCHEKMLAEMKSKSETLNELEKAEVMRYLQIKDLKTPILHTLILFDDATDVFQNPKCELNCLFLRNRHHKFTYFFNVHGFTRGAVPMHVKKNMRSLWYFGGFTRLDFGCSFQQMKSPIDRVSLYEKYKMLPKRDVLFFDYTDDGTRIEILHLSHVDGKTEWIGGPPPLPDSDDLEYKNGKKEEEEKIKEDKKVKVDNTSIQLLRGL